MTTIVDHHSNLVSLSLWADVHTMNKIYSYISAFRYFFIEKYWPFLHYRELWDKYMWTKVSLFLNSFGVVDRAVISWHVTSRVRILKGSNHCSIHSAFCHICRGWLTVTQGHPPHQVLSGKPYKVCLVIITIYLFAYASTRARGYPRSILAGWIRAGIRVTRTAPSSSLKKEEGTGS